MNVNITKYLKLGITVLVLSAIALGLTLVSMWDVEVGLGVLKTSTFWLNYLITAVIGMATQATVASIGLDMARIKYELKSLTDKITDLARGIVKQRNLREFEQYVKEVNAKREYDARELILASWATSTRDKTLNKAIKIEEEIKEGNYTNFNKIKVRVKPYHIKQLMSIGMNTSANDSIVGSVNSFMTIKALMGTLMKLPMLVAISVLMVTNTAWGWDNVNIWLLRLITFGLAIVSGFMVSEQAVVDVEMPTYQTRYNVLKGFNPNNNEVE